MFGHVWARVGNKELAMKFLKTVVVCCGAAMLVAGCQTTEPPKPSIASGPAATSAKTKPAFKITPPVYTVGSEWTYSDGYAIRITDVRKDGNAKFERTDAGDQWFVRRAIFREESKSRNVHRNVIYRTADPMALFSANPKQFPM